MKCQYKVGPKAVVEAEGDSVKQVFERLAGLSGVFALAESCGACKSPNVVPQVREPQGFTYYELQCLACGARLTFGQNKEGGGLFPKVKEESGAPKPNGGWEKWDGQREPRPQGRPSPGRYQNIDPNVPY